MKARLVLSDCEVALRDGEVALRPEDFRVAWAALVALLRTVGYVLKNVDRQESPQLARAIDQRWESWQKNRAGNQIFWEFIDAERNNILKEYAFGYREDDVQITSTRPDGTRLVLSNVPFMSELRSGPFAGQPGLQVARKAIDWWTTELQGIEVASSERGV